MLYGGTKGRRTLSRPLRRSSRLGFALRGVRAGPTPHRPVLCNNLYAPPSERTHSVLPTVVVTLPINRRQPYCSIIARDARAFRVTAARRGYRSAGKRFFNRFPAPRPGPVKLFLFLCHSAESIRDGEKSTRR